MAKVEIVIPKMGEGVIEASILTWLKKVGDQVEEDETLLEIATDKVDSDLPSPAKGKLIEILAEPNEVVAVGAVIGILEIADEENQIVPKIEDPTPAQVESPVPSPETSQPVSKAHIASKRIYSPLVRSIAKEEAIGQDELDNIPGTGSNGRVSKKDILAYLENRGKAVIAQQVVSTPVVSIHTPKAVNGHSSSVIQINNDAGDEVIEMGRMRKLIADHMVMSKHTSPHVTCFLEVDVTEMVAWRETHKTPFQEKYGEKLTFTPLFIQATAKAIKDYPLINVSVEGDNIIKKKQVNIGMATALPTGNLIVPVIKRADQMNLAGLAASVNDLAKRARNNSLKPDEIQGGTFTVSNLGAFRIDAGTPIINQPQVAILALGNIIKKPAVVSTKIGDVIAIRQKMMLSLSFDHRVVDGYLGGSFLRSLGDYIEHFHQQTELSV